MRSKRGFEFSFGWIFSILIGGAVIILAIYATTQLIGSQKDITQTTLGAEFGILLNPIETTLEEAKDPGEPITFRTEARILNKCSEIGTFGEQRISLATKSGIGKEWSKFGRPARFSNKYIFSGELEEGKKFYVFAKPFSMPFTVGSLIYLWTDEYCFVNPKDEIREEIEDLELKNINISSDVDECGDRSIKVCFDSTLRCNIIVNDNLKSVKRGADTVFYDDEFDNSLIYAAIFADPDLYECQIRRLMSRASQLAKVYEEKNSILGCSQIIGPELRMLASDASSLGSSEGLGGISLQADTIRDGNEKLTTCKLF